MKDEGKAVASAGEKLSEAAEDVSTGVSPSHSPVTRAGSEGWQWDVAPSPSSRALALSITALGLALLSQLSSL